MDEMSTDHAGRVPTHSVTITKAACSTQCRSVANKFLQSSRLFQQEVEDAVAHEVVDELEPPLNLKDVAHPWDALIEKRRQLTAEARPSATL